MWRSQVVNDIRTNWTAATTIYMGNDTIIGWLYRNPSSWQNLTSEECIRAYGRSFVSSHSDVIAGTTELNVTDPLRSIGKSDTIDQREYMAYGWMCPAHEPWECDVKEFYREAANWSLADDTYGFPDDTTLFPIQYCLSKPVEEHCRLQLSLLMMCIVVLCKFNESALHIFGIAASETPTVGHSRRCNRIIPAAQGRINGELMFSR